MAKTQHAYIGKISKEQRIADSLIFGFGRDWWKLKNPEYTPLIPNRDITELKTQLKWFIKENKKLRDQCYHSERKDQYVFRMSLPRENAIACGHDVVWKDKCSPQAVLKALENGYTDINIWVYLTPISYSRKEYEYNSRQMHNSAWRIDLDNFTYNGNPVESIEKLLEIMKEREVPLPSSIIATSKNCFHVVYNGRIAFWEDPERRVALCAKLLGLKSIPMYANDIKYKFKTMGLDGNDLYTEPSKRTTRLSGSLNTLNEHELNPFLTYRWTNPNYNMQDPLTESFEVPVMQVAAEEVRKLGETPIDNLYRHIAEKVYDKYHAKIVEYLSQNTELSKTSLDKWAHYFASNFTKLKNGSFGIPQVKTGEELGISQRSLSRQLASMVKSGILVVTKEFNYSPNKAVSRCKEYKFSDEMIEALTEGSTKEQIIETVAQPYPSDRGSVNEQYIYDLAVLARFGLDETDVVEIITHKMLSVPRSAYRDARQIARDFGSSLRHLERKNVPINTKPLFSPELVLERI